MEKDMERLPEKYMDMISGDFAYDPVRLPLDQDSTKTLYNRKTLESIWETARDAQNPYTRQWFDVKYAIPQKELRKEMEDYINLGNIPISAEIDVIADYTKILDEGEMKQLLETLRPDNYTYWIMKWKKINLIRLYCQWNVQNIQTFRNLNGYTYFTDIVARMYKHFIIYSYGDIRKDSAAMNICKEILRLFDLIGLISSDMVGENPMGYDTIKSLINIIWYFYFYNLGFVKIGTIVLRLYSKIFDELVADTVNVLGWQGYLNALQGEESEGPASVLSVAIDKFSSTDYHDEIMDARSILSEDLNHGTTILRRYFLANAMIVNNQQYATAVADALILCMSREIEISDEREFSEEQMREARSERWHNSEALEKGLRLINDIFSRGGMLADILQNTQIVKNIVDMLKLHLTFACEKEGCIKFAGCVHTRIVILVLDILQTVSKIRRGALFGIDPVRIFYEIVERTISKNPGFRVEDLINHFSNAFCHFYLYISKPAF